MSTCTETEEVEDAIKQDGEQRETSCEDEDCPIQAHS